MLVKISLIISQYNFWAKLMDLSDVLAGIHSFTEDVIVVSEAEPMHHPGPKIVFVNEAFTRTTGYAASEVIGKSPRLLQGRDTDRTTTARISERLKSWLPVREEVLNYRKDGTPFWAELSITPIADETGWYRYWVSVQRDVTKRKNAEKELELGRKLLEAAALELGEAARTDMLTGLLNRHGLQEYARSKEIHNTTNYGVISFDLDRFKHVNDTFGHAAGDHVLKVVSARLKLLKGEEDICVRIGGDEFLLVRSGGTPEALEMLSEAIISKVGAPVEHEGHSCRFGVSVGIAYGTASDFASGDLITQSDLALYESKRNGRNTKTFFSRRMAQAVRKKKTLAEELAVAVDNGDLSVSLMPQVDARGRTITGYEALVRWEHPQFGTLLPADFLPLAEQLKLTAELDRCVLLKSADIQKSLSAHFKKSMPVSVNVSAESLKDPHLLPKIDSMRLASNTIRFELLETVLLDKLDGVMAANLSGLRERGIRLEIDDFGTGYASIVGLTSVRPDRLKIDRNLIFPIAHGRREQRIIEFIVNVAKSLAVPTIAEGVENEDVADLLSGMGVDFLQGYFFGLPQPAEIVMKGLNTGDEAHHWLRTA